MNRSTRSPALILKTWPVGDTHRGVRLLLPESGLLDACAYGTAGRKNPLKGILQILTSGNVSLWHDRTNNRYRIESFDPLRFYENIRADIDRIETVSLWSEILIKTARDTEETVPVFALLSSALDILDAPDFKGVPRINRLSAQFLWQYLILSGFQADFSRCALCSRCFGPDETVFWHGEGEILCSRCGEPEDYPLSPGGRIWLEKTAGQPLERTVNIGLEERSLTTILKRFCRIVENLSGTPLKTGPLAGVS